MLSYFRHKPFSQDTHAKLEAEARKLRHDAKMDAARLAYLVSLSCSSYDKELGRFFLKMQESPLAVYVRQAKDELLERSRSRRSVFNEVGLLTSQELAERTRTSANLQCGYTLKHADAFCAYINSRPPLWHKTVLVHNATYPDARLTVRSIESGLFSGKASVWQKLSTGYRKGREILRQLEATGDDWKAQFSAFDKEARRRNYYMLRQKRASMIMDQCKAVLTIDRRYKLAVGAFWWKFAQTNIVPVLWDSICRGLHDPRLFDRLTKGWEPESVSSAKIYLRRMAFANYRLAQIDKDLRTFGLR